MLDDAPNFTIYDKIWTLQAIKEQNQDFIQKVSSCTIDHHYSLQKHQLMNLISQFYSTFYLSYQ